MSRVDAICRHQVGGRVAWSYATLIRKMNDRLESWKEIATYLQRDIRTVQRWEQTAGCRCSAYRVGSGI